MPLKITSIQDFTLHDGPGIRCTIFLAGCPLRCAWCHNPETQFTKSLLIYEERNCIGCRSCGVCPTGAHEFKEGHILRRDKCILCGECVSVCPAGALEFSVSELSDEEYFRLVERQKRLSGKNGGITFSGGEPLMQGEALLRLISSSDIHTAIETCGYAEEALFREVVKAVDYVMFDLKLASETMHKKYTGVSNGVILKNLEILKNSGTPFIIRTPLIPGITDTKANLNALSVLVGNDDWEKLEYNPLTPAKYARIGKEYPLEYL